MRTLKTRTGEAAKLFGELTVAPSASANKYRSPSKPITPRKLGTFTDMSVGSVSGASRPQTRFMYDKE